MGLVEHLKEASEEATDQIDDTALINNYAEPSETISNPNPVETSTLKTLSYQILGHLRLPQHWQPIRSSFPPP